MSTEIEIHVGGLNSSIPGAVDLTGEFDRVMVTAADRPSTDTLPALLDPAADHGDEELKRRRDDVEEKHQRVREFLDATGHDAVVLGLADSVAWFTSGGDLGQDLGSDQSAILLFINRTSRAVITDNVQSGRVFEEELAGLGFQLKERPWYDDSYKLMAELCHNKRVATDLGWSGCSRARRESDALRNLRRRLTGLERQRLRVLGRTLTLAVEATCRNFHPGEREADVAGHLAHRLIRQGVVPVDLRVASDDRLARFRQPTFKASPILKRATIAVTGKRHGLCASVTRIVSFGKVDAEFRENHSVTTMVDATCIFFSRPGEPISEIFRRSKRIYEKFGHAHEWTLDYQGNLIGYSPHEVLLRPDSNLVLESNMAIAWSPSVGAARTEDTVVIDSRGFEVVTAAQNWPQIDVAVKGFLIPRPGILER
ncbi:MAG TPA: M24 family metallopeptidase [Isosphaeraceae bacterium]|nr:M24 family metallopeptidase [Isosphaeraceae bacterium]